MNTILGRASVFFLLICLALAITIVMDSRASASGRFQRPLRVYFQSLAYLVQNLFIVIFLNETLLGFISGSLLKDTNLSRPWLDSVRSLPLAIQILAGLLLRDFMGYWVHRLFHTRFLWRFHAIHHQPTDLFWLEGMRFHLVNFLAIQICMLPLFLVGFKVLAIAFMLPIYLIYDFFVHSNLNISLGWANWVLVSPRSHRSHHLKLPEASGKNFATIFSLWDVIFGSHSFKLFSKNLQCGVEENLPKSFWGQLIYPFIASSETLSAGARFNDLKK